MAKKKEEKTKKDTALATTQKRKLESEVVLYSGSKEISAELEKAQTLHTNDFYTVGNKTVPSARALQWLANRKLIKTRVIDVQSDKTYCRATIAGWIGNKSDPKSNQIYKEATVEMIFEIEMAEKMLDIIRKHNWDNPNNKLKRGKDWDIDDKGNPYFINEKYQDKMMREMLRLRKFALRTVVTKAERIIHSKLADVEWRDEDEMDDEKHEVELVSGKPATPTKTKGADVEPFPEGKPMQEAEFEDNTDGYETTNTAFEHDEGAEDDTDDQVREIPDDLVDDTLRPRDALSAIMGYAMDNVLGATVRPVIIEHYPKYTDGSRYPYHIPETKVIKIVEELTGTKLKKAEKIKKCSKKECGAKITEPETDEQEGLCLKCWLKENE